MWIKPREGLTTMSNFFRMPILAVAIAGLTGPQIAMAQTAAAAPAVASDAKPFVQTDMNLTYTPPAGFTAQDVGKLKSQELDQKAVECNDVVYSAAPPNAAEGYQGLSMGVTIIHPALSCGPKGMVADDYMKAMVAGGAKMPGLTPFKEFATYSTDGRNFAAVIAKGPGATAGSDVYVAMVGSVAKEKVAEPVLLWALVAPDLDMLQKLVSSTVEFTGKKPHELYKVKLK
jgi:hypothetical protein